LHGRGATGETANAFDCRQTIRNLCVNGRDHRRAVGLRRIECALSRDSQEIARGVEVAAERTVETAKQVNLMGQATNDTRSSAATVKAVADDLGSVACRFRAHVFQFFERLSA
jgi:methyl-accepting chemotaxis protein